VAFSLGVFTFFYLTKQLWHSRSAALLAAFLVAFSSPLVAATYGRDFGHGPFALVLVSLHMGLTLAYLRTRSRRTLLLAPMVALALAAIWETAGLYMVLVGGVFLFATAASDGARARYLAGHLLAMGVAGIVLTHLRAERYLVSWPFVALLVATAYLGVKRWLPSMVPGWAYVVVGTGAIAVLARPLAGDGVAPLSVEEYWLYRLRFLFGKPENPLALSDAARFLWSHARTYPSAYMLVGFFLPLVFLIPPTIASLRRLPAERRRWVALSLLAAAGGIGLFLIDRSTVYAAALGAFPLVAISAYPPLRRRLISIACVVAAVMLMAMQSLVPAGKTNPTHIAASILGMSTEPVDGFLWLSIGDADRDLVRHVVSRTSVKDVFVAPPATSALLVGFCGRNAVLTSGVPTVEAMQRTGGYMTKYFDHEDELFGVCDAYGIRYVLYSIDLLLDTSNDSPRYAAGLREVDKESLVYKMHFEPESLEHFNLVYQNDNYRLFRVTKAMEPFFLTDHPPVYQRSLLERHGHDLRAFYNTVVDVLLAYQLALDAQARGNHDEAIRRFRYCLDLAPRFTSAWLGAGDSLFHLGEMEAAHAAYARALETSPDNPNALYNTALTLARLGKSADATGLLDVLIASSRDKDTVERAQNLKAHIAAGAPLDR
jgi:tetratricopeptide (TPR) repeat protein